MMLYEFLQRIRIPGKILMNLDTKISKIGSETQKLEHLVINTEMPFLLLEKLQIDVQVAVGEW